MSTARMLILATANFFIQLLAADKKCRPIEDKKFIRVEQVKDAIFLISKLANRSWKC
jgi:hypothetical protein